MAEPTKMTANVREEILKFVRTGGAFTTACKAAGLDASTGVQWIKGGSSEALAYKVELEKAQAEAETRMVLAIQKAASGHSTRQVKTVVRDFVQVEETRYPDGRVVKKPTVVQLTTTETTEGQEYDWRAGQAWLEARNPAEWKPKHEMTGDFTVTEKPFAAAVDDIYGSDSGSAESEQE